MNQTTNVLIVDDIPENVEIVDAALQMMGYNTHIALSGEDAISKAKNTPMDIALLDVCMPKMNGYELCRTLMETNETDMDIVFVSAMTTKNDIIQGYEAGGADYITKPFNLDVLQAKIKGLLGRRQKHVELKQDMELAADLAYDALTNSAEMSSVLHFITDSYTCKNALELSKALFNLLRHLGLGGTVKFHLGNRDLFFRDEGSVTGIEEQLFTKLQYGGTVVEFGSRAIFNYSTVTLLIRNMPVEDEAKNDRLKDSLAILMQSLVNCIETLEFHKRETEQSEVLKTMESLKEMYSHTGNKAIDIMDKLMSAMENEIHSLGLTELQEKSFQNLMDTSLHELVATQTEGHEIDHCFDNLIRLLTT